ncbi:hypothetical protein R6Z07F_017014 [Ovis aries]
MGRKAETRSAGGRAAGQDAMPSSAWGLVIRKCEKVTETARQKGSGAPGGRGLGAASPSGQTQRLRSGASLLSTAFRRPRAAKSRAAGVGGRGTLRRRWEGGRRLSGRRYWLAGRRRRGGTAVIGGGGPAEGGGAVISEESPVAAQAVGLLECGAAAGLGKPVDARAGEAGGGWCAAAEGRRAGVCRAAVSRGPALPIPELSLSPAHTKD